MKIKQKIKIRTDKPYIEMAIIVLFVTIILIAVLLIQFKTVNEVNETDIENLRDTELRELISSWKSKYEDTQEKLDEVNNKIDEYNAKIATNEESSEIINSELQQTEILLGKTKVTGEGVIVTLTDTNDSRIESSDLLELINELKYAGAEAISINGIRVLAMTDIVDIGDLYVMIKPSQRISSPYVVKAIGNQTYLTSTLSMKDTGYIDRYTNSGKNVKLDKQNNIQIPAYSGTLEIQYMKEVTEE